jgi:hypothetical protein
MRNVMWIVKVIGGGEEKGSLDEKWPARAKNWIQVDIVEHKLDSIFALYSFCCAFIEGTTIILRYCVVNNTSRDYGLAVYCRLAMSECISCVLFSVLTSAVMLSGSQRIASVQGGNVASDCTAKDVSCTCPGVGDENCDVTVTIAAEGVSGDTLTVRKDPTVQICVGKPMKCEVKMRALPNETGCNQKTKE